VLRERGSKINGGKRERKINGEREREREREMGVGEREKEKKRESGIAREKKWMWGGREGEIYIYRCTCT
jgi:hypothetical protein